MGQRNNRSLKGYRYVVALFFFLCYATICAQQDYKGVVLDATSGQPIPYVNIGILEKSIGTVSDEEGRFHLFVTPNSLDPNMQVLFSALGYETLEISLSNIPLVYNEYPVFKMQPTVLALDEVVVSNKGERFITDFIGYRNYGEKSFGYWKDNIALGGELATRILAKSGIRRLDKFQFEVFFNPSDSLLLRVNVYEDDGKLGRPGTNLNKSGKNIVVTVKETDKIVWVDLKPFDIYVNGDFIISLELLKVYGEKDLGLILAAAFDRYGSYRKYASQDKWERIADENMAYYVETSLMVSKKEAERFDRKIARRKLKRSTISGFAILKGRMVEGVVVTNNRTNETVTTDVNGRYSIPADKNDILEFRKTGYKVIALKVSDKPTANVIMKLEEAP
ncbi:MAG: carboxypeptidase-like regulatory domain-containing protein [Bacteroidota bacterium]